MAITDNADDFLEAARKADPKRYAELAERFPINTEDDETRFRIGEPPWRKRVRDGRRGVSRDKRRYTDAEWAEMKTARRRGLREWEVDYAFAKELADESY